ncbi:MAG: tetraacyldisaccharide 4'-kinase, partial [Methylobacteriaceae bacterium]
YRPGDWVALSALAAREGACLVTTEKDAVRLPAEARAAVAVLRVTLAFADETRLRQQLAAAFPRA